MSTPNMGIPEMPQNSMQPSVPFNDAMQLIDALMQLAPQDKDLAAPPVTISADVGKTWIIPASPTGAWAGRATQVALCTGVGLWRYFTPKAGWRAFVQDEAADYRFVSGAWVLVP